MIYAFVTEGLMFYFKFQYIQRTMSMIHPQLTYFFYLTGEKNSVPNCPIAIERIYNPSSGAVYFKPSDENCTFPTYFGLPFFLENYGPRYQDWSVIGHESRPGHHFQYQGNFEVFSNLTHFQPGSHFILPENTRKPLVFWYLQWGQKIRTLYKIIRCLLSYLFIQVITQ